MSILEEKGVDRILLVLLEKPGINQSQLEEETRLSNYKILSLVPRLRDHSLIREEKGAHNQKHLFLTKKGENVARALRQARDALQ